MARNDPPEYGASNPAVRGNYGYDDPRGGEQPEPVPGWRKPIALVGWGVLIAVLIGLIIYGIIELMVSQEPTPATPSTTTATTPATTTATTPTTTEPTTTTTTPDTGASTATTGSGSSRPRLLPSLPHLPRF